MMTTLAPVARRPRFDHLETRPVLPVADPNRVISVAWARHQDEIREAQRLRYEIFAGEMGARLATPIPGYDIDDYDDYCHHLLVRDSETQLLIGTYRVLTPDLAVRLDTTYTETEFDMTPLLAMRPRMLELGRSCVHPDHRHGGVILALWSELGRFMVARELQYMVGCASIPVDPADPQGGDLAASVWHQVQKSDMAPATCRVTPFRPFDHARFDGTRNVDPPPLIKGYLRLGVKVLGAPAWDPDFRCADLPVFMDLAEMPPRYRKRFLG
jgi:putative hemolysin